MYGLSSFFIGEQRVAAELGPMMRAAPTEEMRIFLCTQIADEPPRRVLRPLLQRGRRARVDNLEDRLAETSKHLNENFGVLFDELLKRRVDRLAQEPEDLEALVEAVTIYHMVIEGMLALTGQHFIIDYNEREGTLPGFVEGFTNVAATSTATSPSARASCARCRAPTRAIRPPSSGARGGRARGRGRAAPAVDRSRGRGRGPVRHERARDARVRAEGARAPAEGHRAAGRRVAHHSPACPGAPAT